MSKSKRVEEGWASGVIAGALAGSGVRLIVTPLDVLKIRMQLHVAEKHGTRVPSAIATMKRIYQTEGVFAFWNGHVPAQLLSISYGAVQFGTYEYLGTILPKFESQYVPRNFFIGGCAGLAATAVVYPLDTVRTRIVMQSRNVKVYRSIWHATKTMWVTEGVSSFYRGLVPTLVQAFPHAGLQFGYYKAFMHTWKLMFGDSDHGATKQLGVTVSGSFAGLLAKLNVLPFDVVKKRLQVQGFAAASNHPVYHGPWHCSKTMFKTEGVWAFFRGASAATAKAMLSTSLTFLFYENVLSALRAKN
eukprot:m.136450 g.136450  ORF g.136450 m.136450 type:complete len:302 (+) comp29853_c0_seq1:487-1392(+)